MFGFFKKWSENAQAMQAVQKELTDVMARQGVNFMHLHPEIHRFLLGVAANEGAESAVDKLDELVEKVRAQSSGLPSEQVQQKVISSIKAINAMAKGR
jgi:hypothetical protein